ncbi:hypothetical protein K474DRAFT_527095 [Panus rudis PR-1116 ss-1]|nr:hypothetical protein K474DRAFT_527095 [Panus rudis PR-1116 ss-1]
MASIGEPFHLATYTQATRAKSTSTSNDNPSHVYATQQEASSSRFVTVAAQGDGVHIYDASTLHPVISHTLGPQVTFSCPAVTRTLDKTVGGRRICATYAVIETSPDISSGEGGRTVWKWEDDPSGSDVSSEAHKKRSSAVISHLVHSIHAPACLPEHILLIGSGGQVSLLDCDLTLVREQGNEDSETLITSFVLPRKSCTFVPSRTAPSHGAIIALFTGKSNGELHARIVSVSPDGSAVVLGTCLLPELKRSSILDLSFSNTGLLSILEPSGVWHTLWLESRDQTTVSLFQAAEPVHLKSLTFNQTFLHSHSTSLSLSCEISILPVGASHVLLAGVASGHSSEIVLLLWDLQYSVVLASQTVSIPSTLYRTKKTGIEIQLVGGKDENDHVILVLSPLPTVDPNARSSVLFVPLIVPPKSTIANAMGHASSTVRWLVQSPSLASVENFEPRQTKLLNTIRTALDQKRVDSADDAFSSYVAEQEKQARQQQSIVAGEDGLNAYLSHRFVQQILGVVFRSPPKGTVVADLPYSPKMIRALLEKRVVSSGMLDKGILPALRARNDWESMVLALKTVVDLPETDLVSFLHDVISSKRQHPSSDDAMQVDAPSGTAIPSLSTVLPLIVMYPTSAPALRLALRQQLRDADELVCIFEMLVAWLERLTKEDEETTLLPSTVEKDERGVIVPIFSEKRVSDDIPPLPKILGFLQTFLDTCFLTFLTHPPSHPLIHKLASILRPELDFSDTIQQIRGPLEPFAKAHAKLIHESTQGTQKPDPTVDWRRRKKAQHEQANATVGSYRVEELVL